MKHKTLIHNITIGLLLLCIPVLSSPDIQRGFSLFTFKPFLQNFLSYIILTVFFFCHYYLIIPKFYNKKNLFLYLSSTVLFLSLMILLPKLIINAPPPLGQETSETHSNVLFELFNFSDGLILQFIIVWLLTLSLKTENKLKEIKNQQLVTENAYLKSQINSHFLFNTLNNIYALTLNHPKKAPDAVLKLSQMMRYIVTESNTQKVPLEQELEYIHNYIELQKLRINKLVDLNVATHCDLFDKRIAPIILINFIENAFKYGTSTEKPSKIEIYISTENNFLKLVVKNDIVVHKNSLQNSTKQGIINTQKRLETLYPEKHHLEIKEHQNTFEVQLMIDLKDD